MGAHVWAPAYLRDHLLPHGRITGWTPDWYAGFPALVFYFPLPSLLIVAARRGAAVRHRLQARHRARRAHPAGGGVGVRQVVRHAQPGARVPGRGHGAVPLRPHVHHLRRQHRPRPWPASSPSPSACRSRSCSSGCLPGGCTGRHRALAAALLASPRSATSCPRSSPCSARACSPPSRFRQAVTLARAEFAPVVAVGGLARPASGSCRSCCASPTPTTWAGRRSSSTRRRSSLTGQLAHWCWPP